MNLQAIVETTSAGVTPRWLPTGRRARTHPAIWADAPLMERAARKHVDVCCIRWCARRVARS